MASSSSSLAAAMASSSRREHKNDILTASTLNLDHIPEHSSSSSRATSAALHILKSHNLDLDAFDHTPVLIMNRLLVRYTHYGNDAVVTILLEHGADPNYHFESGDRPLHVACEMGHEHIVRILLDAGADVNGRGRLQQTPLHVAVQIRERCRERFGNWIWRYNDTSESFVYGAVSGETRKGKGKKREEEEGDEEDKERGRPMKEKARTLSTTVTGVSMSLIQLLLDRGADVNATSDSDRHDDRTALHIVAEFGDLEVIEILLDHGADIEAPSRYGRRTPLGAATAGRQRNAMQYLLDRGANINGRDEHEEYKLLAGRTDLPSGISHECDTPMHVALNLIGSDAGLVRFLLDRGAKVDAISHRSTPLMEALSRSNGNAARMLVEAGADIHYRDGYGLMPIHYATSCPEGQMMLMLLDRGADIEARTLTGETPLFRASLSYEPLTKVLLERGANIETRNNEGNTPLCIAAKNGRIDIVRLLLDKGANVNAKNNRGETPLQLVRTHRYIYPLLQQIIDLLLDEGAQGSWRDTLSRGFGSSKKIRKLKHDMAEMSSDKAKLTLLNEDSDASSVDT